MALTDQETREHVARVDTLLAQIEAWDESAKKETALHTVQALVTLYGEALSRIVGYAARHGVWTDDCHTTTTLVSKAFVEDELVSHLLVLHELHPDSVEDRVRAALDAVRPYLRSHGGNVALIAVRGGAVQLRLEGSCKGCPSSSLTLRTAVEEAIRAAAPEIIHIEADGATEPTPHVAPLPLVTLQRAHAAPMDQNTTSLTSDAA
jgi:Fe-S cluster biogenesis protein NfuA